MTASSDSTIRIWDVENVRFHSYIVVAKSAQPGRLSSGITAAAFTTDGKMVAGGGSEPGGASASHHHHHNRRRHTCYGRSAQIHSMITLSASDTTNPLAAISDRVWSSYGREIARLDGGLSLWNYSSGNIRPNLHIANAHQPGTETSRITFSKDQFTFVTRGGDDTVKRRFFSISDYCSYMHMHMHTHNHTHPPPPCTQ